MSRLVGVDGTPFDVVVIGGGIAGAGVARDAAMRGASVALFEKGDFGSGTTSRSSKLVHGGLRYLELFDFALVRESLRERETLGRLAPHLVRPLRFLIPVYRGGSRRLVKVRVGLKLYDWLRPHGETEDSRLLRPDKALAVEPSLRREDLRGVGSYVDGLLLSPERLCLETVLSARRHGARVFNYTEVEGIVIGARGVEGVRVRDRLTGAVSKVGARVVVNAAGPWVDNVRRLADLGEHAAHVVRPTKGVHCLLPRLTEHALYFSSRDDRMLLVVPWRDLSLVGTTDTDFAGDPDRLWATKEEVDYLLTELRRVLPRPNVTAADVIYTYAGVRPLTRQRGDSPSRVSRQHRVWSEGPGGTVLSVTGTKLTCFRSLAQEVADVVMARLGRRVAARTAQFTLDGADGPLDTVEARTWMDVSGDMARTGLPPGTLGHLVETYGRNYLRVADLARTLPDGQQRLCPRNADVVAQLHHAVAEELTVSLRDFLLRRTAIGTSACQGLDCAEAVAARMGTLLGWTSRQRDAELGAYHEEIGESHRFKE